MKNLGKAIKEGLQKSLEAEFVEYSQLNSYKFWQISNIKSFAAFSKKFSKIEIKVKDGDYEIQGWERDSDGSYMKSSDESKLMKVPKNTDFDKIAEITIDCLQKGSIES